MNFYGKEFFTEESGLLLKALKHLLALAKDHFVSNEFPNFLIKPFVVGMQILGGPVEVLGLHAQLELFIELNPPLQTLPEVVWVELSVAEVKYLQCLLVQFIG